MVIKEDPENPSSIIYYLKDKSNKVVLEFWEVEYLEFVKKLKTYVEFKKK